MDQIGKRWGVRSYSAALQKRTGAVKAVAIRAVRLGVTADLPLINPEFGALFGSHRSSSVKVNSS